MEAFFADFKPTTTISISPPGGTGNPADPRHSDHLPLPTNNFPSARPHFIHNTKTGHTALWVAFALFTAGLAGVGLMSMRVEKRSRVFHWLSAAILTVSAVSYLAEATGLGFTYVAVHQQAQGGLVHFFRQVYYARYLDWLFTTPLIILALALLAGLSPAATLFAMSADVVMVVAAAFSGVLSGQWNSGQRYKWAWYAASAVGFVLVWITMFRNGAQATKLRPKKTRGLFYLLSALSLIAWAAYPIVFVLTQATNKISIDAEVIIFGVADVVAKLGFALMLLISHAHGDDDTWSLPGWFVEPRQGFGADGRGTYGGVYGSVARAEA